MQKQKQPPHRTPDQIALERVKSTIGLDIVEDVVDVLDSLWGIFD